MTPHPFVATPRNGPCSSCGQRRRSSIHTWVAETPQQDDDDGDEEEDVPENTKEIEGALLCFTI